MFCSVLLFGHIFGMPQGAGLAEPLSVQTSECCGFRLPELPSVRCGINQVPWSCYDNTASVGLTWLGIR